VSRAGWGVPKERNTFDRCHALGRPIVSEYDIQEITTFYIFQHDVYKSQSRQSSASNTAQTT
jgi:hypothetical protein